MSKRGYLVRRVARSNEPNGKCVRCDTQLGLSGDCPRCYFKRGEIFTGSTETFSRILKSDG